MFWQNQIRLMIGGALGEARGDLMPGFVEAALKTPYKLRVPLAPAEGLVLESQVRALLGYVILRRNMEIKAKSLPYIHIYCF